MTKKEDVALKEEEIEVELDEKILNKLHSKLEKQINKIAESAGKEIGLEIFYVNLFFACELARHLGIEFEGLQEIASQVYFSSTEEETDIVPTVTDIPDKKELN